MDAKIEFIRRPERREPKGGEIWIKTDSDGYVFYTMILNEIGDENREGKVSYVFLDDGEMIIDNSTNIFLNNGWKFHASGLKITQRE